MLPSCHLQGFGRQQPKFPGLMQSLHATSSLPLHSSDFCFLPVIPNFRTAMTTPAAHVAMHPSPKCKNLTNIFRQLHPSHNLQPAIIHFYHDYFLGCACHQRHTFPCLLSSHNRSNHISPLYYHQFNHCPTHMHHTEHHTVQFWSRTRGAPNIIHCLAISYLLSPPYLVCPCHVALNRSRSRH